MGSNLNEGSAYVFTLNGTTWVQLQELTPADGTAGDEFGESVAISGNIVLVGAPTQMVGSNPIQGAAYIQNASISQAAVSVLVTAPAVVTATSGGGQSVAVNSAFASPLVATITDSMGNPVPGVLVTFAAPGSGASATFSGSNPAITNAQGQVSINVTANTVSGSYAVIASVVGVSTPASFALTNSPGAASAITAISGGSQSALVNAAFAAPLVVEITDGFGNPVSGTNVTYASPASGAGVTFPGGNTVSTNANGQTSVNVSRQRQAQAPHNITASVTGRTSAPATFGLDYNAVSPPPASPPPASPPPTSPPAASPPPASPPPASPPPASPPPASPPPASPPPASPPPASPPPPTSPPPASPPPPPRHRRQLAAGFTTTDLATTGLATTGLATTGLTTTGLTTAAVQPH